jgi:diguanylate cyclase (GGDEF)-like protein
VVTTALSRQSRAERRLTDAALRDPVTGALSSGATSVEATLLHALALRHETALSAVLIQFEHASWFGDARGSHAEDSLLHSVAMAWREVLRTGDVLGRIGDDQFLLLLPETDVLHAGALLTRLREAHSAPWTFAVVQWRAEESYNDLMRRIRKDLQRRKKQRSLR